MVEFLKFNYSAGAPKIKTNSSYKVVIRIFFYSIFDRKRLKTIITTVSHGVGRAVLWT